MVKTVLLTLLLPALALAAVPSITRPVTDQRWMLTSREMETVSRALVDLRATKQVQMAVLLVDTTDGQPIEDYAAAVFRQWKGGAAGRNNGVLLVIARADRRSRLEVGYGMESWLTDGEATALLHAQGPLLREGRFEPALLAIIAGVDAQVLAGAFAGGSATTPPWTPAESAWFLVAIFLTACAMARLLLQVQASGFRGSRGLTMATLLVVLPAAALVSVGWSGPRSPLFILVAYVALMGLFFWGWRLFQRRERAAWGLLLLLMPRAALAYSQLWSHDPVLGLGDFFLWVMLGSLFSVPLLLPLSMLGVLLFQNVLWPSRPQRAWRSSGNASSDWSSSTSSSGYDTFSSSSYDSSSSSSSDSSSSSSDWGGGGGDFGGGGGSDSW
ncbi:TPM domain-containing protein [Corallococcus exiguus]|uniref:TPM domain-containing protein n=1 Tax=Corallococcus exiguus TaxID=83462 RepID=UPI0014948A4A|nr:TPM domain-containing protein [Corallococcus exiguus]NPC71733.1 TPM domain-containing protein [Corallococcus exiguus]